VAAVAVAVWAAGGVGVVGVGGGVAGYYWVLFVSALVGGMNRRPVMQWVTPERLPELNRQELWAGIKLLDPALAQMLSTDPNISALRASFGATLRFTQVQADKYIEAGRAYFEEKRRGRS